MSASSIQSTISMVKSYFENYEISEKDLTKPTSDFVMKFYWGFLNEVLEHFRATARCNFNLFDLLIKGEDGDRIMLCQLNEIIQKLNKANSSAPTQKMTIADLYAPTPSRTRNFIMVFIHFLLFLGSKKAHKNATAVFERIPVPSEIDKLQQGIDENIDKLNQNAATICYLEEMKKKHEEGLTKLKQDYKYRQDQLAEKNKAHEKKLTEIEKLKWQKENLGDGLERLQQKEERLRKQVVTDEEFEQMREILIKLRTEIKEYDTTAQEVEETLGSQKTNMESLQNRFMQLKLLNVDENSNLALSGKDLETLASLKLGLKLIEEKINLIRPEIKKKEEEMREHDSHGRELARAIEEHEEQYEEFKKAIIKEIKVLSEGKRQTYEKYEAVIDKLKENIEKLEQDKEKLLKGCAKKYNEYAIAERETTMFFSNMLTEVEDMSKEAAELSSEKSE